MITYKHPNLIKKGSKLDSFLSKQFSSSMFSYNQIFAMLFPIILDQLFIFLISMLTNAMISTSGQDSVSAVGLVNPITLLANSLFVAISSGGTVIVAQYKGKGDPQKMREAASQVIVTTFLVASLVASLFFIFAGPIVNAIFGDADILVKQKAVLYLRGFSLSIFPFSIYNGVFAVLRGVGENKTCLRLTVVINFIHLVLSLLFINGLKLDILGITLSYNIARIIGCAIALYIILNHKSSLSVRFKDFISLKWSLQKSIIKMGIPFASEQIFINVGALIAQAYIVKLGTASVAANTIATSISNLFYSFGTSVALLTITVVGQSIGASNIDLAKWYAKRMIALSTVLITIWSIALYFVTPFITMLYSPEANTLPIINSLILIGIIPIPFFYSMSFVMPSVLRSAGDANYTSIICLVSMWVFRVGLGYVLAIPLGLGVQGVWYGMIVEWIARGIMFYIRFKGTKWYSKKVIE